MTKKEICDECGKETEKESITLIYHKKTFFGKFYSKDFCSIKCLIKFLKEVGWLK